MESASSKYDYMEQIKSSYNSGRAMNYSQMQGIEATLSGKIKWVGCQTNHDTCIVCIACTGKVFQLKNIPKPHYNCDCLVEDMPSDAKETMVYPGDDPLMKPDGDYVWKGGGDIASREGMWTHIVTKEGWREDLNHALPIGAHWDYYDENKKRFRVYPDNSFEFVKGRKK